MESHSRIHLVPEPVVEEVKEEVVEEEEYEEVRQINKLRSDRLFHPHKSVISFIGRGGGR